MWLVFSLAFAMWFGAALLPVLAQDGLDLCPQ